MTAAEVSVSFGLFDVTAKEDSSVSLSAKQPFSKEADLSQEITPLKVATCEPQYWRLDGSFQLFPDRPSEYAWGFWSADLSDETANFATAPAITVTFSGNHSSAGLTLHFDEAGGDYAAKVTIQWYDGAGALLHSQIFQPDRPRYFCEAKVENYQKLVLTFAKSNRPRRYLKVAAIDYGIQKYFGPQDVVSLTLLEEIDGTADALPINSLRLQLYSADDDFAVLNPGGIYTLLQQRQPMYPQIRRHGVAEPLGLFYLEQWQSDSGRLVTLTGQCGLGLLDKTTFYGGMYQEKPVAELLAEIAACCNLAYELDSALAGAAVSGWLAAGSPRQALQQVAFAIGAAADCSRSEKLRLYALAETTPLAIDRTRQAVDQKLTLLPLVTAVEVTAHQYSANEQASQLFSGELPLGRQEILFSRPAHSLTITSGGRFLEEGANYAVIDVIKAGSITISGKGYDDNTQVFRYTMPQLPAGEKENVVQVKDATLVHSGNGAAVAQRLYEARQRRCQGEVSFLVASEKPGDKVTLACDYQQSLEGRLERLEIDVSGGMLGQAVIRGGLAESAAGL